jgi:uncharacterized membrane protein
MKHLLWVAGLIALVPTLIFFQKFYSMPDVDTTGEGTQYLIYSGAFFAVSLICFAIFFFKKFREEGEQEISITKL